MDPKIIDAALNLHSKGFGPVIAVKEDKSTWVKWSEYRSREQTEEEIKNIVDESAEKLKQVAINNRVTRIMCKPLYPRLKLDADEIEEATVKIKVADEIQQKISKLSELISNIDRVYEEQAEFVGNKWQSNKLAMVPGDLLIDLVCKEYGVRFHKGQGDGVRLAALMKSDEIDGELREIIGAISP